MVKTGTLVIGGAILAAFFAFGGSSKFGAAKENFQRLKGAGKEVNEILKEKAEGKDKDMEEGEKNNG